ncbi:hypothetical protein pb186bvf_004887 [Paramecium bursaria]
MQLNNFPLILVSYMLTQPVIIVLYINQIFEYQFFKYYILSYSKNVLLLFIWGCRQNRFQSFYITNNQQEVQQYYIYIIYEIPFR